MHSVIRITVTRMTPDRPDHGCRLFQAGDVFFIRQHCFDAASATLARFCYHALSDLYPVYARVRKGPIGNKELLDCRHSGIVQFAVERLPDEDGTVER